MRPISTETATVNFHIDVDVRFNKPINNLHPKCIQTVIKRLITEHPHVFMGNSAEDILQKIWVYPENKALEKPTLEKGSQLPIVTEEQRKEMSLSLQELGDDDLEWTNGISSARKNKDYPNNFFEE